MSSCCLTPFSGCAAGISAWVACALAMAAGEYVSVATQKDCEEADIQKEREQQAKGPEYRCGRRSLMSSEKLGLSNCACDEGCAALTCCLLQNPRLETPLSHGHVIRSVVMSSPVRGHVIRSVVLPCCLMQGP